MLEHVILSGPLWLVAMAAYGLGVGICQNAIDGWISRGKPGVLGLVKDFYIQWPLEDMSLYIYKRPGKTLSHSR